MWQPFTYRIKWSKINKSYYGMRYGENSHPDTLWTTYFTSSKEVIKYREIYGEPDVIEIRKTFSDISSAIMYEQSVLKRLHVRNNINWINQQENGPVVTKNPMQGIIHSKETRSKISNSHKGKIPWNKGKKCPQLSKHMIENNPMKNPKTAEKVGKKLKGRKSHNKITKTVEWVCEYCGIVETRIKTIKKTNYRFCNKSCAASYSNKKRKGTKYK